jgi:hypothetical protein
MKTKSRETIVMIARIALALALVGALGAGCSSGGKETEEECVDPPEAADGAKKTVKLERFGLGKAGEEDRKDKDWCRACVMSRIGYASCQRVYAASDDEDRESLRAKAREKACLDAKFPKDACPDEAVINLLCKGDAPPPGTPDPGTALQNLYQKLEGQQKAPPRDEAPPKPEAKASEAPPKPEAKAGEKPAAVE